MGEHVQMLAVGVCPTCEEAPRSLRGGLRVALVEVLIGEVKRLRDALEWFADEGHYEGTYRHGAGFVDAVGLTQARAALLSVSPDDADAVGVAWAARAAHQVEDGGDG